MSFVFRLHRIESDISFFWFFFTDFLGLGLIAPYRRLPPTLLVALRAVY